jgi:Tfp pilus assembly protein PilN
MSRTTDALLKYWPVLLVGAGVVGTSAVDSWRLNVQAEDLSNLEQAAEEADEEIEAIQRLLIQRQGQIALDLQRIETQQERHGEDLETILLLLEDIRREGR